MPNFRDDAAAAPGTGSDKSVLYAVPTPACGEQSDIEGSTGTFSYAPR